MKILKMMIAATLVAGAAGAAHADRVVVHHRTTVVQHHSVRPAHHQRVCDSHWVHHRKVKRCYWR